MQNFDLHTHSTYSDGKDTVEEIVLAAIGRGMEKIGISDHSYTFFDESYCMKKDRIEAYKEEIAFCKEKYKNQIEVLCGIEQDAFSAEPTSGYDYVIGSVHYVYKKGAYLPVDESEETLRKILTENFADAYEWTESYYRQLTEMVENVRPDIIGHFDLVTKFNESGCFFDEKDPRYVNAYKRCIDRIIRYGIPFEINTGAVSRRYRKEPYPSRDIVTYLKGLGATFVFSSDAHQKENLQYGFAEWEKESYGE